MIDKPKCDCLNFCGDDTDIRKGGAQPCEFFVSCDHEQALLIDADRQLRLDAERYRWVRERAWYVDAAVYAFELRERWRHGDEPTPDSDDVERALDVARAGGDQ